MLSESQRRLYEKLHQDLGEEILTALADKAVHEIMLNPDGQLWVEHAEKGQYAIGELSTAQGYAILHAVAGIHNGVVSPSTPQLEAELPHYGGMRGERFSGQVPPIVGGPCFTIRKKSERLFTLVDYVDKEHLSATQADRLIACVQARQNILVCGGPGSGKTTLTNALIAEAVKENPHQRFLLLEDTPELQCAGANKIAMLTSLNVNMTQLLRMAMRMRPDRILMGEVRGGEALDMLKAWNTGCPGGICTVHANGAVEAVQRIVDLTLETGMTQAPISLILHTLNVIVAVGMKGREKGFIHAILSLEGYEHGRFTFKAWT